MNPRWLRSNLVARLSLVGAALILCCLTTPAPAAAVPSGVPCVSSSTVLCLNSGRFAVTITWTESDAETGAGQALPVSDDTGSFWFFSSSNLELLIKVLNGCGVNGKYWVFAGGLTNVEVQIQVTDTLTETTRTYTNPQGTPFAPIQDTNAFATCP